jgi:energy-coupling factor transport system permease protein
MIIVLIVSVFFPIGFSGFVVLGATILLIYSISHLNWGMLLKLFRPILFIFIVLLIINFVMLKPDSSTTVAWNAMGGGGEWANVASFGHIVHWKFIWISESAVYRAIYMATRIFLMITLTTILTGTTQPLELTLAIEDLLFPLKLIGIPVYIFSTIISIALRMIPTLIDEAGRIMKAQASRGIDMKNGKLKDKIRSMISLIIPLLVSSFQKAEDLAYAMDSRGYSPHGKRTRYKQIHFRFIDWIIFVIGLGVGVLMISYPYIDVLHQIQIPYIDALIGL